MAERAERGDPVYGLRVVTSPLVPPGTVLVVDPSALPAVTFEDIAPALALDWARSDMATLRHELRMSFGHARITEPDPAATVPARARDWPRWFAAIVAYEVRKAAGALRTRPAGNPRAHAIITGLTT